MVEITSPEVEKVETPQTKKYSRTIIIFIIIAIIVVVAILLFGIFRLTGNNININNQNIVNIDNKNSISDNPDTQKMTAKNPQVLIKTSEGDITLELYSDKAPITVKNFLDYVNKGTYENTVFHRVIKGFMIQGGGFTTDGKEKPTSSPIKLESNNDLKNLAGTIAMARTNVADSATNQFFINAVDNDFLNYAPNNPGYAVFGKVVSGMDVVKKIEASKTTVKNRMEDWPIQDIIINKVEVLD